MASAHTDSDYVCYNCEASGSSTNPVLETDATSYPYDWICVECLVDHLTDKRLTLLTPDEMPGCTDCGDSIGPDDSMYCEPCKDGAYEAGQDDATSRCSGCGEGTDWVGDIYCASCRRDDEEQVTCDECGDETYWALCYHHWRAKEDEATELRDKVEQQPVYAYAGEPIELEWDD